MAQIQPSPARTKTNTFLSESAVLLANADLVVFDVPMAEGISIQTSGISSDEATVEVSLEGDPTNWIQIFDSEGANPFAQQDNIQFLSFDTLSKVRVTRSGGSDGDITVILAQGIRPN